jgi:beta-aspartyl-peptidase (threonine type)
MNKIAIAVHGGAGPDSDFIKQNTKGYEDGIAKALEAGYAILEKAGSSLDAVEAAVKALEDNPLFNAGRGSSLTEKGEAEMCASIMNGENGNAGAAAIVKGVRNPVSLARAIMEKTRHVYLGAAGAYQFAKEQELALEPLTWFITPHALEEYEKTKKEKKGNPLGSSREKIKKHGTVGAVALDSKGRLAAATSTGGLDFCKEGRIADSSMIGVGTYADDKTCAISATGDGEYHMRFVTAFHIHALMEYKGMSIQEAAHWLIHEKCADVDADLGLIGLDPQGNLVAEFNSERMHRGLRSSSGEYIVKIYP